MQDYLTFGLLGETISKSLSPMVYNALFTELGVQAVYLPFPVPRAQFLSALPVLRSSFAGFNVAAPYGLDIMAHLDKLDASARRAGTANTIKVENQKLIGYNTDMQGFERSLFGFMGKLYDQDVLLVGAGGAAHAAANVLLDRGAVLTIISRNFAHTAALRETLCKRYNKSRVRAVKGLSHEDIFTAIVSAAAVDIEGKQSEVSIHSHTYQNLKYAYDMSYQKTAFLRKAESFGAKVKTGFDMLFFHSIGSVKVWMGKGNGIGVEAISRLHGSIKAAIGE